MSQADQNGIGRIVETARLFPGRCMLSGRGDGPFIDLNRDFDLDHQGRIYLRVKVAQDIGRVVGMATKGEHDALRDELAAATARVTELEAELATAIQELDAVELLENRGFRIRRRSVGVQPAVKAA